MSSSVCGTFHKKTSKQTVRPCRLVHILERLRLRFCKIDKAARAAHMANYRRLEISKTEKCSAVAEVALKSVGEELRDSAKLSKLIESTAAIMRIVIWLAPFIPLRASHIALLFFI